MSKTNNQFSIRIIKAFFFCLFCFVMFLCEFRCNFQRKVLYCLRGLICINLRKGGGVFLFLFFNCFVCLFCILFVFGFFLGGCIVCLFGQPATKKKIDEKQPDSFIYEYINERYVRVNAQSHSQSNILVHLTTTKKNESKAKDCYLEIF